MRSLRTGRPWTAMLLCVLALAIPAALRAEDGRFIVKFRPGRAAAGEAALRAAGARVLLALPPQGAVAARIPGEALAGLRSNPGIEYVEVDERRYPAALWNDEVVAGETVPYGVQMVQADQVSAPDAANRRLCIIDSGYSQQHEDLADVSGDNITSQTTDTGSGTWDKDSCGHGSHVAGTVAAIAGNGTGVVGVNPGVKLHIVKVFGNDSLVEDGACSWTYSSNLVAALNSCTAAGSNVVSMSLVGGATRTERAAFDSAYAAGVLSIAAAGNGGSGATSYPAGYDSVVSVAAVDADEAKASFSQHNRDVEIAAPGVAVLSSVPWEDVNSLSSGGTTWSGGRMTGAPRTTGVVGTIVDGGPCTSAGTWTGAVVLCQRGDISFADKVLNVEQGGGVAAVVYNNVASDATCGDFTGTLGRRPRSSIPAIGISCADGAAALAAAGASGTVVSQFVAPESSYEAWNGTSMATPHVSAVAALVWSHCPGKTNVEIRDLLNATALDRGAAGRDVNFGFGIVQAKAALDALTCP